MALLRKKYSEIPSDAVVLTEDEAARYQTKILNNWKQPTDVIAFKMGAYCLGISSFVTGFFINNYYRNKFKLFYYGRAATYLPMCVIPATFSTVLHIEFVLKDVVLQKTGNCPICLEMRGSALQASLGSVFPAFLGPVVSLSLAQKYMTYDVPYITREPMKVLNIIRTTTRPIANILFAMFLGQALLGSAVTYLEAKSVITVNRKLAIMEYELEHS